jgi:MFS family permease
VTARNLAGRFWRLWTASTISSVGDGLEVAALPLLAVSLSADPRLVAGVTTAATLPWLLFALPAGVIVDRRDRRSLMWQVNIARTVLTAAIALLVAMHLMRMPVLYVLVFLLGIGQTVFDNAAQAMLPDLVSTDELQRANSLTQVGQTIGQTFVGPPLGGLMFAAIAASPFAADAATYLIALVLIVFITGRFAPGDTAAPATTAARRSIRADIAEGLGWLFRHPLLRSMALVLGMANLALYMTEGILVLFAIKDLSISRQDYGFLLTGIAIGAVLGGILGIRLAGIFGPARSISLCLAIIAVCYLIVGMLSQAVAVAVVISFAGFVSSVWNIVTISLRQALIPRPIMGRVNSAYRLIGMGSMPIGAFLGGLLAGAFGLRFPFYAAAALLFVSLAVAMARITEHGIAAATPAPSAS